MNADHNKLGKHYGSPNLPYSGVVIATREQQHPEMPLLPRKEQEQLAAWNATRYEYASDVCVPQLLGAYPKQGSSISVKPVSMSHGSLLTVAKWSHRVAVMLDHWLAGPDVLLSRKHERGECMSISSFLRGGSLF